MARLRSQSLFSQNNWLVNNSTALIAAFATIVVALFGIVQWAETARRANDTDQKDRVDERRKEIEAQDKDLKDRAKGRFQAAVTGLGNEKEAPKIGAAILLRTFLRRDLGYEQFYIQTFDLAVAHLRLQGVTSFEG